MDNSDPLDSKGLPQSVSTERLILGAIINQSLDFFSARAVLSFDDFALESHRILYKRIEAMCDIGIALDSITISQELTNHGELESVGGFGNLVDLDNETPRFAHYDEYLRIVKSKSILRKIVMVADRIRSCAILEQGAAEELLAQSEQMLVQLGLEASSSEEFRTPKEIIIAAGGLQKYLDKGKHFGVPTGFDRLDRMTCGMRPGQLWILAAFTSCGKSTFARNIALNAALHNYPCAFITLEMSDEEVTEGLICALGGIDSQLIRRGFSVRSNRA